MCTAYCHPLIAGTKGGSVYVLFDEPSATGQGNALVLGYFSNFIAGSCIQAPL